MLADRSGLTAELSTALRRRSFTPVHDRGRVLVDVAVMLADGGEAICDIEVLRHQAPALGPVASAPTVWWALDELTPAAMKRVQTARARVRRHVWAQLTNSDTGLPVSKVAGTDLGEVVVLDVDATIVVAHSEKEQASPTFKKTFGFHPLAVWCDNTTEFLGRHVADREGRPQHRRRPHHRPGRGDHPDPGCASQEAAGPLRRSRRLPRPPGLAHRTGQGPWPQPGLLGGVPGHREGPRRDRPGPERGMDACDRR